MQLCNMHKTTDYGTRVGVVPISAAVTKKNYDFNYNIYYNNRG